MSALTLTKHNFKDEVLASEVPVLVDFWAPWCGPCRMMSPVIEELAGELSGKVKVGKVNVDEEMELASQFRIVSIPTLALLRDGKLVSVSAGARPKAAILQMLGQG